VWALVSGNLLVTVWQYLSLRSALRGVVEADAPRLSMQERVDPVHAAAP
jgi:hypothetical protein